MRQIGRIPGERNAQRFRSFLLIQGIDSSLDEATDAADEWEVWVLDEDKLDDARAALAEFEGDPDHARYADADDAAKRIRDEKISRRAKAARNRINARQAYRQPDPNRCPVTMFLIVATIFVLVTTSDFGRGLEFGRKEFPVLHRLWIEPVVDVAGRPLPLSRELTRVKSGEVWRLVTPIFIHFGVLHFLFNTMWLFQLGTAIESNRGSWRLLLLVLLIAVVSNYAQFAAVHARFGGMSGVVFGLFGYVWMKGRYDPTSSLFMPQSLVIWMVAWFLICLTPAIPAANWAHGVGLLVGGAIGGRRALLRLFG